MLNDNFTSIFPSEEMLKHSSFQSPDADLCRMTRAKHLLFQVIKRGLQLPFAIVANLEKNIELATIWPCSWRKLWRPGFFKHPLSFSHYCAGHNLSRFASHFATQSYPCAN